MYSNLNEMLTICASVQSYGRPRIRTIMAPVLPRLTKRTASELEPVNVMYCKGNVYDRNRKSEIR